MARRSEDWCRLQRVAIAPSQLQSTHLQLTDAQGHYLYRVLRLQGGDRFVAMDGLGHWWLAELAADDGVATLIESLTVSNELPLPITLLAALPKGNGMDDLVRQSTELGVSEIVPVMSDRTLLQPSPQKVERWRRIAREAAEQSERQVIPILEEPLCWADALNRSQGTEHLRFLCAARGNPPLLLDAFSQRLSISPPPTAIVLATGPEGGLTEAEEALAIAQQFHPISLGPRILRTVTAPGAAIAIVANILESHQFSHRLQ